MAEEPSFLDSLRDVGRKFSKCVDAAAKCLDKWGRLPALRPSPDPESALAMIYALYILQVATLPGKQFEEMIKEEATRQLKDHRIDANGDQYCKLLWRLRHNLLLLPDGAGCIVADFFRATAKHIQGYVALHVRLDSSCPTIKQKEDCAVNRGLFVSVNSDAHQAWLGLQDLRAAMDCLGGIPSQDDGKDLFVWWRKRAQEISMHYALYRLFEVLAHMRAWETSDYGYMPEADRASFREIVTRPELFNYVEDCKREIKQTGAGVPDEWLQVFFAAHLGVGMPLPEADRDHLAQILDAMYPRLLEIDLFAQPPPLPKLHPLVAAIYMAAAVDYANGNTDAIRKLMDGFCTDPVAWFAALMPGQATGNTDSTPPADEPDQGEENGGDASGKDPGATPKAATQVRGKRFRVAPPFPGEHRPLALGVADIPAQLRRLADRLETESTKWPPLREPEKDYDKYHREKQRRGRQLHGAAVAAGRMFLAAISGGAFSNDGRYKGS